MKIPKPIICFLCFLIVITAAPAEVFASSGSIDIYNEPILTLEFSDDGKPLSGAEFDLFLIADIDENGNYLPKKGFEHFGITALGKTQEDWRKLAATIEGYVLQNKTVPYDSGITDENGIIEFPVKSEGLVCGLYLLVGYPHSRDGYVYQAESTIIQLPSLSSESGEWQYDVFVKPKYSFEPENEKDTVTRKVLKIWNDGGMTDLRPKEITVYLLCDGKVYDTVILSSENNWRYTWENLDDDHRWTVTEKIPEGYTVTITKEGITFVITNTPEKETPPTVPEKPDEPKLPQTGQLWWPVPMLAVIGTAFIMLGLIRRRSSHEE